MTDALEDLKEHWGSAYAIWRNDEFRWYAQNRQTRVTLRGSSPAVLRILIRADYDLRRTSAAPTPGGEPTS